MLDTNQEQIGARCKPSISSLSAPIPVVAGHYGSWCVEGLTTPFASSRTQGNSNCSPSSAVFREKFFTTTVTINLLISCRRILLAAFTARFQEHRQLGKQCTLTWKADAVNASRGQHTWQQNSSALITSIFCSVEHQLAIGVLECPFILSASHLMKVNEFLFLEKMSHTLSLVLYRTCWKHRTEDRSLFSVWCLCISLKCFCLHLIDRYKSASLSPELPPLFHAILNALESGDLTSAYAQVVRPSLCTTKVSASVLRLDAGFRIQASVLQTRKVLRSRPVKKPLIGAPSRGS